MTWDAIVKLIVAYGIPQAFKLWEIASRYPSGPTPEAWEELKALSLVSYDDYIRQAEERAKINPS